MRIEWDDAKARSNLRKHGIDFNDAMNVFSDPLCLTVQDRIVDGEMRWQSTGAIGRLILVVVAHVTHDDGDDDIIRIISARPPTRQERRIYEEQDG